MSKDKDNLTIVTQRRFSSQGKSLDDQKIGARHPWADSRAVPTSVGNASIIGKKVVAATKAGQQANKVAVQQPTPAAIRYLTTQTSVRPSSEFTIEEERIRLAAQAGPLRLFAAVSARRDLQANVPRQLATGTHAVKFVRVEPIFGEAGTVIFSTNSKGSRDTAPTIVFPDEGPFDLVLLPDEELYGFCETAISLKILEIVV